MRKWIIDHRDTVGELRSEAPRTPRPSRIVCHVTVRDTVAAAHWLLVCSQHKPVGLRVVHNIAIGYAADPACDISTQHGAARPTRDARPSSSGRAAESGCAGGLHAAVGVVFRRRQPRAAGAACGRAQRAQAGPRQGDGAAWTLPESSVGPAQQEAVAAEQVRP